MEGTAGNERDKVIVRVLADTGIRVAEEAGLHVHDLLERDRRDYLLIDGMVPLTLDLAKRLRRFIRTRPTDVTSDRLFLSLRRSHGEYQPLTESGIEQLIRELGYQAGIGLRVYPHLLRHTFATFMLRRDREGRRRMDSTQLRFVLCHSSTTMIDTHC